MKESNTEFQGRRLYIMLPAYNEEKALPLLFDEIKKLPENLRIKVVVIDDGSSDTTYSICDGAREYLDIFVIRHEVNKGLGKTMYDGMKWLSEQDINDKTKKEGEPVAITLDADNTQPIEKIPDLLGKIDEGYDLVIASRFQKGARVTGLNTYRRFLSWVASFIFRILFPNGARDYTCGYRAYRLSTIKLAFEKYGENFINQPGFDCMADILIKIGFLEVNIGEIPFFLHYERKPTGSKMKVLRTIYHTLSILIKRRFGNMS
ncbi:MAG: glycosyltransferase family 2 protein [Candidatus Coatesbacteria bacterium]|nr:glycosyltransferase family 2 protein [Candidatus Coatesbacteria bacterium]